MEQRLREKFTLIDKSDPAAIAAAQQVLASTVSSSFCSISISLLCVIIKALNRVTMDRIHKIILFQI